CRALFPSQVYKSYSPKTDNAATSLRNKRWMGSPSRCSNFSRPSSAPGTPWKRWSENTPTRSKVGPLKFERPHLTTMFNSISASFGLALSNAFAAEESWTHVRKAWSETLRWADQKLFTIKGIDVTPISVLLFFGTLAIGLVVGRLVRGALLRMLTR